MIFLAIVLVHTEPPLLARGTDAPAIVLQSDTGVRVDVLRGAAHHAVVVEFFETACVSCQHGAPALCAAGAGFPDVTIVAVDAGAEAAPALRAFVARYLPSSCNATVLVDPAQSVSHAYRAAVVPTVYVVDRNGKIAYGGVGPAGIDGLAAALRQLHA